MAVKKKEWSEGQPCDHPGCLSHVSHPCEGCGRIGGREPGIEPVTLWMEGKPRLYVGRAEVVSKESAFVLKMRYSDEKAEAVSRNIGSRYHFYRVSSELTDKAVTFWPYQFWLKSVVGVPAFDPQWMYLWFEVIDEQRDRPEEGEWCI